MKKTAVIILTIFLFVLTAGVCAEESAEQYGEAAELLFSLKILDKDSYKPEKPVTRGDFASAVAKTVGLFDVLEPCDTVFSDVDAGNKNSGAINALTQMSIIGGYGDGTFRPDDTLLREQAVKILVSATGYDIIASSYGGYPGGYLTVASTKGMLKKIDIGEFKECTWDVAAQLIYNALFVDLLQNENETYTAKSGENILNKWFDISKKTGIVSATEITALDGQNAAKKGCVRIDGKEYADPKGVCTKLFGLDVTFYSQDESAGEAAIISAEVRNTVSEWKIAAEAISDSTTATEISYYDESTKKTKKIAVDSDADVIYNGKYLTRRFVSNDFKPAVGGLRLVDCNADGSAETVFINDSVIYIVDSVNVIKKFITDKYDAPVLKLDSDNKAFKYRLLWDGIETKLEEVVKGSVLSVAKSEDGLYLEINIFTDRVRGEVTERSNEMIAVDGVQYEIKSNVKTRLNNIKIGETAMFYLDEFGKIVGSGKAATVGVYGYLLGAGSLGNDMGTRDRGVYKVYSLETQKIETFASAKNIKLNDGVTETGSLTGKEIADRLKPGGKIKRQLIKYDLNADNEVSILYIAKKNTSNPEGCDETVFSLDFDYPEVNNPMPGWNYLTYSSAGVIASKYLTSGAKCINIPSENADGSLDEQDIYSFSFETWTDTTKIEKFKVYDADEEKNIGVFILEGGPGGRMPAEEMFIVDKYGKGVDEDGREVKRLYGYENGEYTSYSISSSSYMTDAMMSLSSGDAVKLIKDQTGILSFVKIFAINPTTAKGNYLIKSNVFDSFAMFSYTDTEFKKLTSAYWHYKSVVAHIRPTFASETTLRANFENGAQDRVMPTSSKTNYIIFDENTGRFSKGSWEDIEPGNQSQTILLQVYYQEARDVLIINWKNPKTPFYIGGYNN